MNALHFDDEQVRELLDIKLLFLGIRQALIDLSAGRVLQPLRSTMELPGGLMFLKPAMVGNILSTKLITFFPDNSMKGLPTMLSTIILMEAETGLTLATMDGAWITALRTAVVSAIGVDALTTHTPKKVALLGSGVLARTHARAFREVREIEEFRVWSPNSANAKACADEITGRACATAQEAVEGADIVCTVTNATTPVLLGSWLKPGAFVAAVGAPRPTWRELDDAAMQNVVIADSREAAEQEAGDVILSGAKIYAEIGEILSKAKAPPQEGKTVIFKALGQAVEDAVGAQLVYDAAGSRGA